MNAKTVLKRNVFVCAVDTKQRNLSIEKLSRLDIQSIQMMTLLKKKLLMFGLRKFGFEV